MSTIPKTGTHFIEKFLEALTGKKATFATQEILGEFGYIYNQNIFEAQSQNGETLPIHWYCSPIPVSKMAQCLDALEDSQAFLYAHAPYSLQYEKLLDEKDYVNFLILRDPRDYAISLTNHLRNFGSTLFPKWCVHLPFEQQLLYVLYGTHWYNSTRYIYEAFLPWKNCSNTCTLRYEYLMGPSKSGCSSEEHLLELRKISEALEIECTDDQLLTHFQSAFGQGYTFTPTKVGTWRETFSDIHLEICRQILGDLLIELGYEE